MAATAKRRVKRKIVLELRPDSSATRATMLQYGYKPVLELNVTDSKRASSVLSFLCNKWSNIPLVSQRLVVQLRGQDISLFTCEPLSAVLASSTEQESMVVLHYAFRLETNEFDTCLQQRGRTDCGVHSNASRHHTNSTHLGNLQHSAAAMKVSTGEDDGQLKSQPWTLHSEASIPLDDFGSHLDSTQFMALLHGALSQQSYSRQSVLPIPAQPELALTADPVIRSSSDSAIRRCPESESAARKSFALTTYDAQHIELCENHTQGDFGNDTLQAFVRLADTQPKYEYNSERQNTDTRDRTLHAERSDRDRKKNSPPASFVPPWNVQRSTTHEVRTESVGAVHVVQRAGSSRESQRRNSVASRKSMQKDARRLQQSQHTKKRIRPTLLTTLEHKQHFASHHFQ